MKKRIGAIFAGIAVFVGCMFTGLYIGFALQFSCFKTCSYPHPNILLSYWAVAAAFLFGVQLAYFVYTRAYGSSAKWLAKTMIATVILLALALVPVYSIYPIQKRNNKNQRIAALENMSFGIYLGEGTYGLNINPQRTETSPAMYTVYINQENRGYFEVSGGNYSELKTTIGQPPCNLRNAKQYLSPGSLIRKGQYYTGERYVQPCQYYPEYGLYVVQGKEYERELFYTSYVKGNTILLFRATYPAGTPVTSFLDDAQNYISTLELKTPQDLVH